MDTQKLGCRSPRDDWRLKSAAQHVIMSVLSTSGVSTSAVRVRMLIESEEGARGKP
jgi:hypothetical protein